MLGTHGCGYAAERDENIGWRADCYGDVRTVSRAEVPEGLNWKHMYDAYPKEIFENGVEDRWMRAPVTLETCWVVGHWFNEGWDVDWIIEQGYKYHLSVFMPKSCYIPEEWAERFEEFNKYIGYRLVLRQAILPLEAERGSRMQVRAWIDNVGCAPLYRPYKLAYRFRRGKRTRIVHSHQDVRAWLPDHNWFSEDVEVPGDLEAGTVEIDVGIVDALADEPRVKFAIDEIRDDGWHPLCCMDLL